MQILKTCAPSALVINPILDIDKINGVLAVGEI